MQKRYVFVIIVLITVCVLIWKLSDSYGFFYQGYEGNNVVSGDKWGINIMDITDVNVHNKAILTKEVTSIGTTLNFNVSLFKPGDYVTFDFTVTNTSKLNAELYAITLAGISPIDSEIITYEVMPLDYVTTHSEKEKGSILKKNESHTFRVTVRYEESAPKNNIKEYNLSLGSTIIYKQV